MVKLLFKSMLLLRADRYNSRPNAHWVAVLKKYWRHHASHLCQIIDDAMEMAEKEDDMNIKPLLPHSDVILYLGQDGK